MSNNTVSVTQEQLDKWRAATEQTRTDLFTVRQLIARGQGTAATQLIGGMLETTILVGLSMEDAGANRPHRLPPKPTAGSHMDDEDEED